MKINASMHMLTEFFVPWCLKNELFRICSREKIELHGEVAKRSTGFIPCCNIFFCRISASLIAPDHI